MFDVRANCFILPVLEGALSCFFVPQKQRALPGAESKAKFSRARKTKRTAEAYFRARENSGAQRQSRNGHWAFEYEGGKSR